jgi:type I restriction enzyme S subunit
MQKKDPKWKVVDLCDAVEILDNLRKPVNSSERQARTSGTDKGKLFPYYGATGQVGWIDEFITDGQFILVGEDGAPFLEFHKQKAYKINGKSWVNNHAHILLGKHGVCLNDFLLHYLNSLNYRPYVNGTTRLKLTKTSLSEIPLPLPPIREQQLIVSKLEELFSELDKGKQQLETALQQLKIYRQAVLKSAFEGKLTNRNVKDGELPNGWSYQSLGGLLYQTPQNGIYKPSSEYGCGVRIIRIDGLYDGSLVQNYNWKRLSLSFGEIERYKVADGDILINRVNSLPYLGKCGFVSHLDEPTVFESNIMKIRLDAGKCVGKYLSAFLSSNAGLLQLRRNAKHAVNQASINQKDVCDVSVPLPGLDEQLKVLQEIESRLSVCDKMEETIINSLKQAETLRQSILKKAFEGKLIAAN